MSNVKVFATQDDRTAGRKNTTHCVDPYVTHINIKKITRITVLCHTYCKFERYEGTHIPFSDLHNLLMNNAPLV